MSITESGRTSLEDIKTSIGEILSEVDPSNERVAEWMGTVFLPLVEIARVRLLAVDEHLAEKERDSGPHPKLQDSVKEGPSTYILPNTLTGEKT
ncbi:hypothetical protein KW790_01015 [Candidatus Parcubacteria bacterium]|nr:hypothetical protein [Candidatus Parcubacteria bacterium]